MIKIRTRWVSAKGYALFKLPLWKGNYFGIVLLEPFTLDWDQQIFIGHFRKGWPR